MKKTNKYILILVAVLLMLGSLAGCAKPTATPVPPTAVPATEVPAEEPVAEEPAAAVVDEAAAAAEAVVEEAAPAAEAVVDEAAPAAEAVVEKAAADIAFPEREVTILVPFNAGGASDMTSRILATGMQDVLGKTVLVVNKPGGSGGVGMTEVRGAKADGYTICYIPVEIVMHEALKLSDIKPSDFDYIGQMTDVPAALTVQADAPYNTVEEFIAYAKEHEGEVKIGNSGTGSIWHIASTYIEEVAGVKFNHIPFDGAAPAVTALMGGHIDAVPVNAGEVKSGVDAGKLKILALMTEERDPNNPDVPTMKESGYDVVIGGWGALAVPKGTDPAILAKLSNALKAATDTDEFKDFISQKGMMVHYRNAEDFAVFIDEQAVFFNDLLSKIELGG